MSIQHLYSVFLIGCTARLYIAVYPSGEYLIFQQNRHNAFFLPLMKSGTFSSQRKQVNQRDSRATANTEVALLSIAVMHLFDERCQLQNRAFRVSDVPAFPVPGVPF